MSTGTPAPIDLDTLRRLESAATEAPWRGPYEDTNPGDKGWWILGGGPGMGEHAVSVAVDYNPNAEVDARLAVAARNALPGLLALIDGQSAEVERLTALLGEQADRAMAEGWSQVADQMDRDAGYLTVILDPDQRQALRLLLSLVHYDDLAQSWRDLLPRELLVESAAGVDR